MLTIKRIPDSDIIKSIFDQTNKTISKQALNKEYLAIPEQFDKLMISFRTAYAKEYSLDKEQTSYSDSIDALRLACKMCKMN